MPTLVDEELVAVAVTVAVEKKEVCPVDCRVCKRMERKEQRRQETISRLRRAWVAGMLEGVCLSCWVFVGLIVGVNFLL
jgi:hypothetical protein